MKRRHILSFLPLAMGVHEPRPPASLAAPPEREPISKDSTLSEVSEYAHGPKMPAPNNAPRRRRASPTG